MVLRELRAVWGAAAGGAAMTRRRYIVCQDHAASLNLNGKPDHAVYDRQREDEWPIAVFASRADARRWAKERNRR